jgi:hypothetical protein
MGKKDLKIIRKLFVLQADILALNKIVEELIAELEKDQESEPTPLPETPS